MTNADLKLQADDKQPAHDLLKAVRVFDPRQLPVLFRHLKIFTLY